MRLATGTAAGRAGRKAALIHAVLERLEQRQLLSVQGEYYNVDQSTYAFTSLVGRRTDANIDFAWGGQSPIAGAEGAAFAARWTGTLTPTQSGSYTFKTSTDDGVRLWIDNNKIIDYWWRGVYDKYSAPVQLTAGQTYNVRMEYFQLWSGSKCSLAWSRDGGAYTAVPASVLSLPTQTPFSGSAPSIDPAGTTIQAEDFDIGSNGVSYYDTTAGNAGGSSYRANIDADIETFATGARAVGYVAPGEWLEYAINVPQGGDYTLDARVASSGQGGSFHVAFNDVDKTGSWTIPSTGSWTTYATQSRTVNLSAGQQIMRVCFDANGPGGYVGNVDWLKLTPLAPAAPTNLVATAISSSRIDLSWRTTPVTKAGLRSSGPAMPSSRWAWPSLPLRPMRPATVTRPCSRASPISITCRPAATAVRRPRLLRLRSRPCCSRRLIPRFPRPSNMA